MSANTAELTLLIKAKNLVDVEVSKVKTSLGKLTVTAKQIATDMTDAFKSVGRRIGNQLGNLATDILSGGKIENNLVMLGATLAGAMVEGLSAHFIPMVIARVMSTAAFAPLAAAMTAGGITLGSVLATAIAVGAAAFPFILAGLAIAALIYVATNPEFRQKARAVALQILANIGEGLKALGKMLYDRFSAGVDRIKAAIGRIPRLFVAVFNAIVRTVTARVNLIVNIIKRIARAVANMLIQIAKINPFTSGLMGIYGNMGGGRAAGGPVSGGTPYVVGERGPEVFVPGRSGTIVPNHALSGGGRPVIVQLMLDGRKVAEVVDERLYYALRDASPTIGRV